MHKYIKNISLFSTVFLIPGACLVIFVIYRDYEILLYKSGPFYKALHPHVSLNTNLVIIPFGNDIYQIPRNYLTGVTEPTSPGKYAGFSLEVLLPDFEPRTPENINRFNVLGHGDKLRALFEYGINGTNENPPEVVLNRIFSTNNCKFYVEKDGEYDHYHLKNCATTGRDIYLKKYKDGHIFYETCSSHADFPSPDCVVMENLRKDISIYYAFSTKYQYMGADIDLSLRKLVNGFVKK